MKNINYIFIFLATFSILSSCKKDEGKLPNISFKTGGNYVSADKMVNKGDTVLIGISASKAEDKDVLKTFSATKSVNGASATSIDQQTLSGADADAYSKDFTITAGSIVGTEKYTFTVVNRDGLTNQVSLTLTVQ